VAAHLYFRGPAVLCLSEFPDELVQGENIQRYLPTAVEGADLLLQKNAPDLAALGLPAVHFTPVTDEQLAALAERMRYVLHF
jgi:hypothetical protein